MLKEEDHMDTSDDEFVRTLLADLIRHAPESGREGPALDLLESLATSWGLRVDRTPTDGTARLAVGEDTVAPPMPEGGIGDNLVISCPGSTAASPLLLVTHVDVAPPLGWCEAFTPSMDGESAVGRGACDALGQVVTVFLVLRALAHSAPRRTVHAVIVSGEESGGWGLRTLLRRGLPQASAALVLEPTNLRLCVGCRGALWARLSAAFPGSHMGSPPDASLAPGAMFLAGLPAVLAGVAAECAARPQIDEAFAPPGRFNVFNIGAMRAPGIPSAQLARLEVDFAVGYACDTDPSIVIESIRRAVSDHAIACGAASANLLPFHLCNCPYYLRGRDLAIPHVLESLLKARDLPSALEMFPASCDANILTHEGGLPAFVFGPGELVRAHSRNESIAIRDIHTAAEVILALLGSTAEEGGIAHGKQ